MMILGVVAISVAYIFPRISKILKVVIIIACTVEYSLQSDHRHLSVDCWIPRLCTIFVYPYIRYNRIARL